MKMTRKIIALILCALMLLALSSCTKIIVELVYDAPPTREVVATLPPETEPPTTEPTTVENVKTGEEIQG